MDWNNFYRIEEVEAVARAMTDTSTWAYIAGGAGKDLTVTGNVEAFHRIRVVPRLRSRAITEVNLRTSLFGQDLALPVLLAPTSPQRLLHPQAELATASAAAVAGTIAIVSADSHYAYPQIHAASGGSSWFQLYAYGSRHKTEQLLDMAAEAGARALVVTMDATYSARRLTMKRAGFTMPSWVDFGTLREAGIDIGDASKEGRLPRLPLTWDDLVWIRARTRVPLLVKGVLHPEDACRCLSLGVDGIIVSNHGGRQLDSVIPSIEALGPIVDAVKSRCPILLDSGIRSGLDVFKALSRGADAVCLGRPYLWGLAAGGEAGVSFVLQLIQQELQDALLQAGASSVADLREQAALETFGRRPPKPAHPVHPARIKVGK